MELILFNGFMIIVGGLLSNVLKKTVSLSQLDFTLTMVNITVLMVGISGAIKSEMPILMLVSMVVGSFIGSWFDLDQKLQNVSSFIEKKFDDKEAGVGQAFVLMVMIHCVGSMAILGPLNLGLSGDGSLLLIKAVLDFISTMVYGSIYGYGVMGSSVVVVLYQGVIFLLSSSLRSFLTPAIIVEIGAVGSILIVALAFHLLKIKDIKVANGLPAILVVITYQLVLYLW